LLLSSAAESSLTIETPPGRVPYGYQVAGAEYASGTTDTLIADPPGLGKTIQAILAINYDPTINKVLIVCPAFLKINWHREIDKWLMADLTWGIASGTEIIREQVGVFKTGKNKGKPRYKIKEVARDYWPDTDIVIINYELLKRFYKQIQATKWDLFIADEADYANNLKAERSKYVWGYSKRGNKKKGVEAIVIKRPPARKRIFLTGTPEPKHTIDLWQFCKEFDPQGLGKNYMRFIRRYCDAKHNGFGLEALGATNTEELQNLMRAAFMVRRNKREVLKDLPEKHRQIIPLPRAGLLKKSEAEMTAFERAMHAYEKMQGIAITADEEWTWESLEHAISEKYGHLMAMDYADAANELDNFDEKIAFEAISLARQELALAKLPMCIEHVKNLLRSGEKVVVFGVHTKVIEKAAEALKEFNPRVIVGSTPNAKRQQYVDDFQDDPTCRVILGNIGAMGVGWTLTAARFVCFFELSWVPRDIEQAEDRIWRIGQRNECTSQHLVVEGSTDAQMAVKLLERMENIAKTLDKPGSS